VRNYKYFIALLWTLESNILLLIIFAIVLFADYNENFDEYKGRVDNPRVYIAFTAITFIVSLAVLAGNSYLLGFHSYLQYKGISTFDFILMRREKKEKAEKKDDAVKTSNNNSYVGETRREGREKRGVPDDI
jgi:hypothetical protein